MSVAATSCAADARLASKRGTHPADAFAGRDISRDCARRRTNGDLPGRRGLRVLPQLPSADRAQVRLDCARLLPDAESLPRDPRRDASVVVEGYAAPERRLRTDVQRSTHAGGTLVPGTL